jgi:hypothetical protein
MSGIVLVFLLGISVFLIIAGALAKNWHILWLGIAIIVPSIIKAIQIIRRR